jgi:hypothetical protein
VSKGSEERPGPPAAASFLTYQDRAGEVQRHLRRGREVVGVPGPIGEGVVGVVPCWRQVREAPVALHRHGAPVSWWAAHEGRCGRSAHAGAVDAIDDEGVGLAASPSRVVVEHALVGGEAAVAKGTFGVVPAASSTRSSVLPMVSKESRRQSAPRGHRCVVIVKAFSKNRLPASVLRTRML